MSKINELILKLCPNGVEMKRLGDVFTQFNGMTGVSKKWENSGNCVFIDYLNAYNNIKIDTRKLCNATVKKLNQEVLKRGDVLFTTASEVPDECAISSVIEDNIADNVFLDDHLFGIRAKDEYKDKVETGYLKYIFRATEFRLSVRKVVRGVTRFYISKNDFMNLSIPLLPLPIQEEIVRILDKFTELEAELEAELECRKKQYEYYRNSLLSFNLNDPNIQWKKLGEIGTFTRGNGLQKKDFTESGVGCIHYGQIYTHYRFSTNKTISYCSSELAKRLKKAKKGDLIIATTSENIEDVCKAVVWLGDFEIGISGDACVFSHNQNPKYIGYWYQSQAFFEQKKRKATGTKVIRVSKEAMANFLIPLPPLSIQEDIVRKLDKFEALTSDLQSGLPAEIDARRKQYEHYRDRLLSFKRADSSASA